MKTYIDIENKREYTIDELRIEYCDLVCNEPITYEHISFAEYMKNCLGKNGSLKEKNVTYLVVGFSVMDRERLIYHLYSDRELAEKYISCALPGDVYYQPTPDRYESENREDVYEIHKVDSNSYYLVEWHDTDKTEFNVISGYDVLSDANRDVITRTCMELMEDHDDPVSVSLNTNGTVLLIGTDVYGWNIIDVGD